MKEALGIALTDSEIKIAYLAMRKGRIHIVDLKSQSLRTPIKQLEQESKSESKTVTAEEFERVFVSQQHSILEEPPIREKKEDKKAEEVESSREKLFSFLNKFPLTKTKLALNLAPATVTYYYLDSDYNLKDRKLRRWVKQALEARHKKEIPEDCFDFIQNDNGTVVAFVYDSEPLLLEILEELRAHQGDRIHFALMDTNEVALVNLIRNNYYIPSEEISAIIYIENEFSRIVFMRGRSLLHCSALINEDVQSSHLLDIIRSKIIYEQDQYNIPELSHIFLASKCVERNAHAFFSGKFSEAKVEYISSPKVESFYFGEEKATRFSEYAIPISLAWKALEKNNTTLLSSNLLPSYILDRQKVLKLAYHGYILLALLGLSAFVLTWQIASKKSYINSVRRNKQNISKNLEALQQEVDKVYEYQTGIKKLRKNMTLVDSLGTGYNQVLNFLQDLNSQVKNTRSIWIKELKNTPTGFQVKGLSLESASIPQLSYDLGNVNLRRVTHTNIGNRKVFEFEFEKSIPRGEAQPLFGNLEVPKDFDQKSDETRLATASSTPSATSLNVPAKPTELVQNTDTIPEVAKAVPEAENPPPSTWDASRIKSESPITKPVANPSSRVSETDNGNHKTRPSFDSSTGDYTIFLSTHASLSSAQRDVERLKSQGYEAQIYRSYSSSDGLTWYRVHIGRFSSRDEALTYAQQIVGVIGKDYWVGTIVSEVKEPVSATGYASGVNSELPVSNTSSELNYKTEAGKPSYESSTGDYTVFVSTHASLVSAQRDVEHLKSQGYEAQIHRFYSSSDAMNWYRVSIGRFPNRDEALGYAQQHVGVIGKGYWVGVLR